MTFTVHGVDIHPGLATGKLVNAARLAGRVLAALPAGPADARDARRAARASSTPYAVDGSPAGRSIRAIVRDFDDELLDRHVALLRRTADEVVGRRAAGAAGGRRRAAVLEHAPVPRRAYRRSSTAAERAIRAEGLEPRAQADPRRHRRLDASARRGLPTPNIFTGGHEYHSVREWASVQDMASAAAVVVRLAEAWAPSAPPRGAANRCIDGEQGEEHSSSH